MRKNQNLLHVILRKFTRRSNEMKVIDLEREHNELMHLCSKVLPPCKEEDEENCLDDEIEKGQTESVLLRNCPELQINYGNTESIRLTKFKRLDSISVQPVPTHLKNPRKFQRSLSVEEYCKMKIKHKFRSKSTDQMLLPLTSKPDLLLPHQRKTFRCHLPPAAIIIISLLEILSFVIDEKKYFKPYTDTNRAGYSQEIGVINFWLRYDPYRRSEIWRFITYMFVHVDVTHLAVNIVTQLIFGIALELLHGWWRTILIYLVGVIFGVLGTSIEDPNIYLVGASSGVYSLLAACIVTVVMNWRDLEYALIYIFVLLLVTVTETVFSLLDYFDSREDLVSYMAHLFGAIAGFSLGISILIVHSETTCKRALRFSSTGIFVIIATVLICCHFMSVHNCLIGQN